MRLFVPGRIDAHYGRPCAPENLEIPGSVPRIAPE